jgi:hypothetical protein
MTCNVIILTGGLTGSSVLSGVLRAAGFWTGEQTFEKPDYNTHENSELISLNRRIMEFVGVGDEYTKYFMPEAVSRIAELEPVDSMEFAKFVADCDRHSPWLWKDPRLWLTIRFWDRFLPRENVRFILLDRELFQAWVALSQRRLIQTWECTKRYHVGVQASLRDYLVQSGRPFIAVRYEDLIVRPEVEIARVAAFLETPVTMKHLTKTYKGQLYRKNKGIKDAVEAVLIYLKNYKERLR